MRCDDLAASVTRGFLVVTPGITIKDRLRVLQPNDPDSYYAKP
jgi:type III restriction enzyme